MLRRKNWEVLVIGRVTDLLVPSSIMVTVFVLQLATVLSVGACSKTNPVVPADAQERMTFAPERRIDSVGWPPIFARAIPAAIFPPAMVKLPATYKSLPDKANPETPK